MAEPEVLGKGQGGPGRGAPAAEPGLQDPELGLPAPASDAGTAGNDPVDEAAAPRHEEATVVDASMVSVEPESSPVPIAEEEASTVSSSIHSAQAARMVRQHEEEVLLLHFHRWILMFSLVVCLTTPSMIALLVWLVVSYLECRDIDCDVPLRTWVYVVCLIVGFNATVNRPTTTGSCVQRMFCRWTRDPADPQPMPLRVRLYNWTCALFVFSWNCLGIHWVNADGRGGGVPCQEAAPKLYTAVKVYASCNLAVTIFMYVNMFGIAQLLRMALRQGLLHTSQAAPKGSLEKNTVPAELGDPLLAESPQCSICLDDFNEATPFVKTKVCGHLFHRECLSNWLQVNRTCPLCREDLGSPPAPPAQAPDRPPAPTPESAPEPPVLPV